MMINENSPLEQAQNHAGVLRRRNEELEQQNRVYVANLEALLDIYKQWRVSCPRLETEADLLCASVAITIAKMKQDLEQKLTDLRTAAAQFYFDISADRIHSARLIWGSEFVEIFFKKREAFHDEIERSRQ